MILATAFDFDLGVRPGWWVLLAGLAVALVDAVRGLAERRRPLVSRPSRANAPLTRRPTSPWRAARACPMLPANARPVNGRFREEHRCAV
jgi:hypothetical protein